MSQSNILMLMPIKKIKWIAPNYLILRIDHDPGMSRIVWIVSKIELNLLYFWEIIKNLFFVKYERIPQSVDLYAVFFLTQIYMLIIWRIHTQNVSKMIKSILVYSLFLFYSCLGRSNNCSIYWIGTDGARTRNFRLDRAVL